jgi:signal peptidase I
MSINRAGRSRRSTTKHLPAMAFHVSRFKVGLILAGFVIAVLIGGLIVSYGLRVVEMSSPTMEPLVFGRSQPDRFDGDRLLITRRIRAERIHRGDLVVVEFPFWTNTVVIGTVRRIAGVPGDTITNRTGSVHFLAPGYFWVEAQQTNGLDSHAFGPIHQDNFYGRVIRVFHVRRVTPASLDK